MITTLRDILIIVIIVVLAISNFSEDNEKDSSTDMEIHNKAVTQQFIDNCIKQDLIVGDVMLLLMEDFNSKNEWRWIDE